MRDGSKQSEITKFKRDIMKLLYSNPDIIEMLDNKDVDPACPDTAVGRCIFDYIRIPGTKTIAETYLCLSTICPKVCNNEVYKELTLTIVVICEDSKMAVRGQFGNRIDIISGDIVNLLNQRDDIGFEIKLDSDTEDVLKNDFSCRTLKFKTIRSNKGANTK